MKKMLLLLLTTSWLLAAGNQRLTSPDPTIKHIPNHQAVTIKSIRLPDGIVLEYAETGDRMGTPVIFLHGLSDSWRSYQAVAESLPSDINGFFISQRGHGGSSKPLDGYSPKAFASDIAAFIKALKIHSAVIVGHSLGGTVAQQFAIDYPSMTNGLVLIATFPTFQNNTAVKELSDYLMSLDKAPDTSFIRAFQESTIVKAVTPTFMDTVINESLKLPLHVWKRVVTELLTTNLEQSLARISIPTLIIWGDKDSFCPLPLQKRMADMIPQSIFKIYEATGHAVHWEDHTRFVKDLRAYLNSLQSLQGLSPD